MMQRNRWWIKVLNVPVMERSAECRRSAENRPDWRVPGGRTWSRDSSREILHAESSDSAGTRTNPLTLDVAEGKPMLLSEFGRGSARKSNRRLSVVGRRETVGPTLPSRPVPPETKGWGGRPYRFLSTPYRQSTIRLPRRAPTELRQYPSSLRRHRGSRGSPASPVRVPRPRPSSASPVRVPALSLGSG